MAAGVDTRIPASAKGPGRAAPEFSGSQPGFGAKISQGRRSTLPEGFFEPLAVWPTLTHKMARPLNLFHQRTQLGKQVEGRHVLRE